jgi:pyruvate carboxylase subunit B
MIVSSPPRMIRVMFTPFRDGLQSTLGGKVRLEDVLPAMEAATHAGVRHFEFGGGALFQAPFFYVGQNPFDNMRRMRTAVGPDVDLQILTRSVSGVTLTNQAPEALALQAKVMAAAGTTIDRNFDYMNDVRNLVTTGRPILEAGMHHQPAIALMGLPFASDRVHTPEFYIDVGRQILDSGIHVDSICLKDASGTTDPTTIYRTAVGLRKLMPPELPLSLHTHDTAGTALTCYLAGIHGGVDSIDLSLRPLAGGTSQPDIRSMAHILHGTGYSLDIDVPKLGEVESLLEQGLKEYEFNPATTAIDARVLGFPMPGGAIGPNVHMMVKAGIIDRYTEVLAEFPVVVEAGGAWTSVTPGSQQYWLQAFNNVLYGRWERLDEGYAKAVLGYFGRTPMPPDPEVVRRAAEQLAIPPFDGDPLEAAPRTVETARQALEERNLPLSDENIFLVLSAMVPGRRMELNEGIRLLAGNPRIDIPLRHAAEDQAAAAAAEVPVPSSQPRGPVTTQVSVREGDRTRTFTVTLEPLDGSGATVPAPAPSAAPVLATGDKARAVPAPSPAQAGGTSIYSNFGGSVEVADVLVKVGDRVAEGAVIAQVEAMKAKHDIRTPVAGTVTHVHVAPGREITSSMPIATIA